MNWWMEVMPVEGAAERALTASLTSGRRATVPAAQRCRQPGSERADDRVMLIRNRKSRIYFLRQFFDYPIQAQRRHAEETGLGADHQDRR